MKTIGSQGWLTEIREYWARLTVEQERADDAPSGQPEPAPRVPVYRGTVHLARRNDPLGGGVEDADGGP